MIKQNTREVIDRYGSKDETLFKKLHDNYDNVQKSEYEARKAHLKSLRDLKVPVHSEEYKEK